MGDETYLEAFVETLGTLPHSVRRDLDLMKDLDRSHSRKLEELRQLQHEYIQHVEGKVLMNLEIVKDGTKLGLRSMNGQDIVVPTTQELFQYTHQDYPEMYSRIEQLQRDCLQLSDEKVSIAKQIHKTIDGTVQRLDKDIEAVETILQATGEFYVDAPAQTNELVACQVNPGDEWILAKVVGFDDTSMMYKLADEDVESNKMFEVPEQQVVTLTSIEKLRSGDSVFAVYPDTTSFYPATVVQTPKKSGGATTFVMVKFIDDADEFGQTHEKAVKYVMFPPFESEM